MTAAWRVLLLVAAAAVIAAAAELLPVADWLLQLATTIRDGGAFGVFLFFVAFLVSSIAFVPGSLLTLVAGFAYGPLWGLAVASPASVAGASAAFLLGRTVLRHRVIEHLERMPRVRAIDRAVEREGFRLVLLLRLSPLVPFPVLNYALSVSSISFSRYAWASFVGMIPGTLLYLYLGSLATTAAGLDAAPSASGSTSMAFYIAGLVATGLVVVLGTRAARRALKEDLQGIA